MSPDAVNSLQDDRTLPSREITMPRSNIDTVRAMFDAYLAHDPDAADQLLADDVSFTSPQDDHIDKQAYFQRCFPTADRLTSQEIVEVVDAGGDSVFVMYEYELRSGDRHRNTEFITVCGGQITDIHVFFGGQVRRAASPDELTSRNG